MTRDRRTRPIGYADRPVEEAEPRGEAQSRAVRGAKTCTLRTGLRRPSAYTEPATWS